MVVKLSEQLKILHTAMVLRGEKDWIKALSDSKLEAEEIEKDLSETLKLGQTLIAGISWFNVEKEKDRFYETMEKWEKKGQVKES